MADGIRIYFDFTITNHLIYKEEKSYVAEIMREENMKNFSYVPSVGLSPEFLCPSNDTEYIDTTEDVVAEKAQLSGSDEPSQKRRLRSHKGDEDSKNEGVDNSNNR